MSAAAEEIARDDQSGEALAERWNIEYLKASSLSVDPRALSLLERSDCKRLQAIPLSTGSGGTLVAVSSPSEERFAAIRELTGEQTRFVLISEGTLEALLGSRMFAEAAETPSPQAAEQAETAPEPPAVEAESAGEDPGADPGAAAPTEGAEGTAPAGPEADAAVENIVGAVLHALKHRVGSTPDPATTEAPGETTPLPGSMAELLTHLDTTVETWGSLRAALGNVDAELEETKRALRETKEQLSVAHADNDQYRKRVRALEGELEESRELVAQARTRLQEAAELLEAGPTQIEPSAELL